MCRVAISEEFQRMLDAVEEEGSNGGDALVHVSQSSSGSNTKEEDGKERSSSSHCSAASDALHGDADADDSLVDLGDILPRQPRSKEDDSNGVSELHALVEEFVECSVAEKKQSARGMFDDYAPGDNDYNYD